MFIKVIGKVFQQINSFYRDASFYLEQNDWDDYNYHTTYFLHVSGNHTEDRQPILIGEVKILKLGQQERDIYLVPKGELLALDATFCSLGQSLDYYERIAQLDKKLRDQLLLALRDSVIYSEFKKGFTTESGWIVSILRNVNEKDDLFVIPPIFMSGDYYKMPSLDLKFNFQMPGMESPMEFDFDSPKYGYSLEHSLPNRIAVIIGRNGSGKSTLLSKISRVAFASTKDRKDESLMELGIISPIGLGFPKIVNLTYSAFDSFQVPGIYKNEKEQICKDIKRGVGRYIFCGIRDIAKELEETLPNIETDTNGKLYQSDILEDKQKNTLLKPILALADEFYEIINKIRTTDKISELLEAFAILREEPSLHNFSDIEDLSKESIINLFLHLSTGHKFVLHSIANVIAYTEPRSLVLFDEPESHLHPPILAVLMKAIRNVLNNQNAFMIVATHSPVVLQETLSKHVYIITREGTQIDISKPYMQTYGENIGLITSTVFGLSSDITDYHSELDIIIESSSLYRTHNPDKIIERIETLFNGELSMQARAYILSKVYKK